MSARKRLLIYPKFQLALVGVNLVVLAAYFVVVFISVTRSYDYLRSEGLAIGLKGDHSYFKFIDLQARLVYQALVASLLAGLGLSTTVVLILSNKLAGPIVRLREYFQSLLDGEKQEPLSFRRGDFFPELPELVNRSLDRLRGRK